MNPPFKRMALFAAVVRHGSMSGAARAHGMSTSAVSQQVRLLEEASGVTLLHRSTRKLSLTDAGARFAEHCHAMVAAAEQAGQQLALAHDAPVGELRMSAPVGFAGHVAQALAPLLADHPALSLRLLVDDAMIDLIDARIDLAVRAGRLADSSWAAKRLCTLEWLICASPAYLRGHAAPGEPAGLSSHQWLAASPDAQLSLRLHGPANQQETLHLQARIVSNNQQSLQQMCLAGLGLAVLVRAEVAGELRVGRLVPVLPDWRLDELPVWAVTPQRENQPAKVRHAVAALQTYLDARASGAA